jgi:hypothetical protein
MYFEALIKCTWNEETSHEHCYIVKAEDQSGAMKKVSKFISTYFVNEEAGTLLIDHDNVAYRFSDDEIVELIGIAETTPEKFLEDWVGELFLIT